MRSRVWLGCLTSLVFAGAAEAAPPTLEAVQRLQGAAPGAQLRLDSERLARVYGAPLAGGASPEQSAAAFVQAHSDLFGLAPSELLPGDTFNGLYTQPVMYEPDQGTFKFTLVYYRQYTGDLPVYRAELRLLVRNVAGFPIVWVGSSLRDLKGFVAPADAGRNVAADAAQAAAARAAPGLVNFTPAELTVWAGRDNLDVEPAVALVFVGDNGRDTSPDYEKWLFVADAATGEVLYRETQVLHTDIYGSVDGMATDTLPPKADVCNPENPLVLKYAKLTAGDVTVYTDENGDFVMPYSGTEPLLITSSLSGIWFDVQNQTGPNSTITYSVTPPGPIYFMHNSSNGSEFYRAEVNGYVQANVVRDWVLSFNAFYPVIYNQLAFPVKVNIYDSCNAFYNGVAINMFRALGGCSNTAYSGVIHHEYGHHLVAVGGSGQGQYGEGLSDVVSMLIADDPILGYGFYSNNCAGGIRSAINQHQYPCEGEIHDCGMLFSGCVWDTRNALAATYPDTYLQILSPLAVNSILLHDGNLITPAITIDFLILDDDDGFIYNGTPHYNEICTGFAAHNMGCPPAQSGMTVTPTTALECWGAAGGPFTPTSAEYVLTSTGSAGLDYEVSADQAWVSVSNAAGTLLPGSPITCAVSLNANVNSLPLGTYVARVRFTNMTTHVGDTTRTVTLHVDSLHPIYTWSLDTDHGWTSSGGAWAFGVPAGLGGEFGCPDPTAGHTGGNVYGYNLNGDYTNNMPEYHLTTTAIDCTGRTQVKLRFWRWLGVERRAFDHADVSVSNDGLTWTPVWQNPDYELADCAWTFQECDLSGVADDRPTVYVRWTMGPTDGSWRYCGWNLDDVEIWAVDACTPPSILGQPYRATRHEGESAMFAVTASGTLPLEYQWRKDGTNIDGATQKNLTLANLTVADRGSYDCIVTNTCGAVSSAAAELNVWRLGDLNCDELVDFDDINPFVLALSDPVAYEAAFPTCYLWNADCNTDGQVDFGDINAFVALLSGR